MSLSILQTRIASLLLTTLFCCLCSQSAMAGEAWTLSQGGKIHGATSKDKPTVKNPCRTIAPTPKIVVTLAANTITHRKGISPAMEGYEATAHTYADTVADQWKLVSWCQAKRLYQQRDQHLRRIVELDPEENGAWRALGYIPGRDGWMTRDEKQARMGYYWFRGAYRNSQEIHLLKMKSRRGREDALALVKDARQEFEEHCEKLQKLRSSILDGKSLETAKTELAEWKGEMLMNVLATAIGSENDPQLAQFWILTQDALQDTELEPHLKLQIRYFQFTLSLRPLPTPVFETLVNCLAKRQDPTLAEWYAYYLMQLEPSTQDVDICFDRVCIVLRRFKLSTLNPVFIEALVSRFKTYEMQRLGPTGDVTTAAVTPEGETAQTQVNKSMEARRNEMNPVKERPYVLQALLTLNDKSVSFGFDQAKWRAWDATRTASASISAR